MNTWIIVAIAISLLIVGSLTILNFATAEEMEVSNDKICGTTCKNSCTEESNCGLASCGIVSGKACGCGS